MNTFFLTCLRICPFLRPRSVCSNLAHSFPSVRHQTRTTMDRRICTYKIVSRFIDGQCLVCSFDVVPKYLIGKPKDGLSRRALVGNLLRQPEGAHGVKNANAPRNNSKSMLQHFPSRPYLIEKTLLSESTLCFPRDACDVHGSICSSSSAISGKCLAATLLLCTPNDCTDLWGPWICLIFEM